MELVDLRGVSFCIQRHHAKNTAKPKHQFRKLRPIYGDPLKFLECSCTYRLNAAASVCNDLPALARAVQTLLLKTCVSGSRIQALGRSEYCHTR